ncbi:MAG: METTL5 family protein [Candidatus Thermoplasmatota archaeon]
MKKKHLEMILQQVPLPKNPKPELEQYVTPATIAADIIFLAYHHGDIEDKIVVDLGCGTGIFAVGAFLAGASQVYGFDIDKNLIRLAQQYTAEKKYTITYQVCDVTQVSTVCDTVIMNPPFGAQKSNQQADRRFLEKAYEIGQVIYSLHLTKTLPFIRKMIAALPATITFEKTYRFPIPAQFAFHEKTVMQYDVSLIRSEKKDQKKRQF